MKLKHIAVAFTVFALANVITQKGWLFYLWLALFCFWIAWTVYLFMSDRKKPNSTLSFADLYAMHLYAESEHIRLKELVDEGNPFAPSGLEYFILVDGSCQLEMDERISRAFPELAKERQKQSDAAWKSTE